MVKRPVKKRAAKRARGGPRIEATRLAVAAFERVREVLRRTGHGDRVGLPVDAKELLERDRALGQPLPPSYLAAMQLGSGIGGADRFLDAGEMRRAVQTLVAEGADESRLVAFAESPGVLVCFDRGIKDSRGELGIVEVTSGTTRFAAANFGEWLDQVADEREENIHRAAAIPEPLRELLTSLGFSFEDPVVGRLETGDTDAIAALLGEPLATEVRGDVNRLFDASGKASLTLNLDEFTLAAAVRTGIYVFEAAEVFRWLRRFRDQDFFKDAHRRDDAESVRDLRAAPPEPPIVERGTVELALRPSTRLTFVAASGRSAEDFYVLGRTPSTRGASHVLHVERGVVTETHELPDSLTDLHVTDDGTAWGLSQEGTAVVFSGGPPRALPLKRPTPGRTAWYGIGGDGIRPIVWGAGALLAYDGVRFAPFGPDPGIDPGEVVVSAVSTNREIAMLVSGNGVGAVARFDGRRWQPIDEDQLIETALLDLDVHDGQTLVLTRDGRLLGLDDRGTPRERALPRKADALRIDKSTPRPLHGVRSGAGAMLLATEGGVVVVGGGDPVYYAAIGESRITRLARVGGRPKGRDAMTEEAVVVMIGRNLWLWRSGALSVVDARSA